MQNGRRDAIGSENECISVNAIYMGPFSDGPDIDRKYAFSQPREMDIRKTKVSGSYFMRVQVDQQGCTISPPPSLVDILGCKTETREFLTYVVDARIFERPLMIITDRSK